MELKYTAVFIAGIILAVLVVALCFLYKDKVTRDAAVKLANTDLLLENQYYKNQLITYYVLRCVLILSVAVMIFATAVLLARPYYIKKTKEQKYNRDIIICLDISSSVDELNLKLVKELEDTVRDLSGERIGIVIFNTSPIVLSPLTDDYEYTIEQLDNIHTAIKTMHSKLSFKNDNWLYWNEFLYGGTLVGNELRGSSLIGDGLLGGLFAFPKTESDRTKVIIFATDNDPNGEGFVNITEAAEYCKKDKVTVYGIGTETMNSQQMNEMKNAVELTGGKFFLEESSSAFHEIVDEIEQKSESLVEGKTIIKMVETPEKWFILLIVSFVIFVIASIILRRGKIWWSVSAGAMAVLLALVYLYAIVPAHQFSKGPELKIKKKSNLNVVFVIDDTVSMLAKDMTGVRNIGLVTSPEDSEVEVTSYNIADVMEAEGTRLKCAKDDICAIVDALEGAEFSVISFNNDAMLLAPASQDIDHVKNAVKGIYPLAYYYAKGSTLDAPKELLKSVLKSLKGEGIEGDTIFSGANSGGDQKTAVFFISDGEITSESNGLSSYSELSPYIDGGIVMGYGTKEGGTMRVKNYEDEYEEIEDTSDWPYTTAISIMDEKNLKQIAADLGIEYKNMTSDEISSSVSNLKKMVKVEEEVEKIETKDEYINPPKYYGYYYLIPFALLVLINAGYVIKKR